jgi:hypothetical protein
VVVGRIVQGHAPQERDIAASPARSKHLDGNSEGRRLRAGIVRPIIDWSDSFRMFSENFFRRLNSLNQRLWNGRLWPKTAIRTLVKTC